MFETFLGTWEGPNAKTSFQWIPEYVLARVLAPKQAGPAALELEAYFYEDVITSRLRCLALSKEGSVYEGEFRAIEDGGIECELQGYTATSVIPLLVRLEFEKNATLRQRVWSLENGERKLMLDLRQRKS